MTVDPRPLVVVLGGHLHVVARFDAGSVLQVSAHDAATVVLTALKQRKRGETLKDAVLRAGPYQGLQQEIAFDKNGDTRRRVYFRIIRAGSYAKFD